MTERDRGAIYGYYRPLYTAGNCPRVSRRRTTAACRPARRKNSGLSGSLSRPDWSTTRCQACCSDNLRRLRPGYQYVRIANDILMMAIGMRLIAGAIADLGKHVTPVASVGRSRQEPDLAPEPKKPGRGWDSHLLSKASAACCLA